MSMFLPPTLKFLSIFKGFLRWAILFSHLPHVKTFNKIKNIFLPTVPILNFMEPQTHIFFLFGLMEIVNSLFRLVVLKCPSNENFVIFMKIKPLYLFVSVCPKFTLISYSNISPLVTPLGICL